MAFDPNLPANHSEIVSAELRAQFNGLKALIDDLTARVAALENPPHVATGFEAPGANGLLTEVGTWNGKALYQAAGGWYFGWMGTPPGWWTVQPDDPRVTGSNGVYYRMDENVAGQYVIGGMNTPAGSVS